MDAGQEADLLVVHLVNTFDVKDLRMNLAHKEVYQLINETNNV